MNRKLLLFCVTPLALLLALVAAIYFPVRSEDSLRRGNRTQVQELVRVGQKLTDAENLLGAAGFKLGHADPITPTVNRDYLHQLVIIGNTQPNMFETIGYTAGFSWLPFTHTESPYVVIDAELDGMIREIR